MKKIDFWQNMAKTAIKSDEVTHKDIWQRSLEIETIKRFLKKNRTIDIGCGNGYTTGKISPFVKEIIGIDYSSEMIKRANKEQKSNKRNIAFFVKDVLKLSPKDFGMFDTAISERCLINLDSWSQQKKAIKTIASVIKKAGKFIFIEGSKDGRENLSKFREKFGLPKMPKVWHNLDFEEAKLLKYISKYFNIEKRLYFGVYDLISRVVHPLLVAPLEPEYSSKINEIACLLALENQGFNSISRVIFLVLRKK